MSKRERKSLARARRDSGSQAGGRAGPTRDELSRRRRHSEMEWRGWKFVCSFSCLFVSFHLVASFAFDAAIAGLLGANSGREKAATLAVMTTSERNSTCNDDKRNKLESPTQHLWRPEESLAIFHRPNPTGFCGPKRIPIRPCKLLFLLL